MSKPEFNALAYLNHNNKILPYLFLGFVAVMYLGMDVIGVAVVGLCIAFLVVNNMQFEEEDDF